MIAHISAVQPEVKISINNKHKNAPLQFLLNDHLLKFNKLDFTKQRLKYGSGAGKPYL